MYDYLIVGSGLFGATFANYVKKHDKKVLVIDRRSHLGGNVFCDNIEGINVHKYGPHIFHTNDQEIWDFVNSHCDFNNFQYSPVANYKGRKYSLPFNMNTFYELWQVTNPADAQEIIRKQVVESEIVNPRNLEEQAISMVGRDIYEILIKGYSEKQWGRSAVDLPPFIIKRLPVRFTFDNNYFNDRFQGIPVGGYNVLINSLLKGIDVRLNVDFFESKEYFENLAKKIVFTGPMDEFFNYEFGALEYRSLLFESEVLPLDNFQGVAAVNYTDINVPYTRIVEHKHFERVVTKSTVITREFPKEWKKGSDPYYPINDSANNTRYLKYKKKADQDDKYLFGGRLADYKYYDMHQVIASALARAKKECE